MRPHLDFLLLCMLNVTDLSTLLSSKGSFRSQESTLRYSIFFIDTCHSFFCLEIYALPNFINVELD